MHEETNAGKTEMKELHKNIKVLRQRLKGYKTTAASTKLDIGELKEEQQNRERETKLQAKLKTFETSIMDMTKERQKSEDSYKTQIKELEQRSSDLENSLSSAKYDNDMLKITIHQNKAQENMEEYRKADRALLRERTKAANLHRKLEELNNKLAKNSGKCQTAQKPQESLRKKKDIPTTLPRPVVLASSAAPPCIS
ncbi:hypothetical protein SKAU_G00274110 [Synaphobranchus kaupii]|uniref:Uncharacterized protein n=1 Tax=Synaphobranchus kaupii TaxID=118154 RepID=A0A9Q1F0V0_SYNKA|nr:hypothetical protein SKAU_G00274110 [Synaphobranchus kaupii]